MWHKIISLNDLQNEKRWVVEIFQNEESTKFDSVYQLTELQHLVTLRKESINPQEFPSREFNFLGLENVESHTGDLVDFDTKPGIEVRSVSKMFFPNDVLYGRLRPYLNKVYVAQGQVDSGICSGEFYVMIPDTSRILPNFLREILSSQNIQSYVSNLQTGTALPRLHIDDLLSIHIPCPPLEVQQHIEDYLISENNKRRKLAKKLAAMPKKISQRVIEIIETGEDTIS